MQLECPTVVRRNGTDQPPPVPWRIASCCSRRRTHCGCWRRPDLLHSVCMHRPRAKNVVPAHSSRGGSGSGTATGAGDAGAGSTGAGAGAGAGTGAGGGGAARGLATGRGTGLGALAGVCAGAAGSVVAGAPSCCTAWAARIKAADSGAEAGDPGAAALACAGGAGTLAAGPGLAVATTGGAVGDCAPQRPMKMPMPISANASTPPHSRVRATLNKSVVPERHLHLISQCAISDQNHRNTAFLSSPQRPLGL